MDAENLNLGGTQRLSKKGGKNVAYQHRKKGKTSNLLILTDGGGFPIAISDVIDGYHNDLHDIVKHFGKMIKGLKPLGIVVDNSVLNADKGFDSKSFRRYCDRRKIFPNIKENTRNRKNKKRGRKQFSIDFVYKRRFVNEGCFAWMDNFKNLLIRFDRLKTTWINWHFLPTILLVLKV